MRQAVIKILGGGRGGLQGGRRAAKKGGGATLLPASETGAPEPDLPEIEEEEEAPRKTDLRNVFAASAPHEDDDDED